MSTIVIDPGHGGNSPIGSSSPNNARGPNGTLEKNMTLVVSIKTAEILNQLGHIIILTRNNDVNLGLANRARIAANNNADVFVSIHFNGNENPSVQGTESWVHPGATNESNLLGSSLQQRLLRVTGYANRGLKSNNFGVLNPAFHNFNTAACLIEISFITDPNDEGRLLNPNYRTQLAQGIAHAIVDFFNRSTNITPLHPALSFETANEGDA